MARLRTLLGLVALASAVVCLADEKPFPLAIGDSAPALVTAKFVKGTPITSFEPGKVYVVDMWATWCGPCRRSIPHMTELAKQYGDKINIVGVSVWERKPGLVEPFVEKMGDKMDYSVATDVWPEGATDGRNGTMASTWMDASGMTNMGIPTVFVVGRTGAIEWVGHPDDLAKPLEEVVAGTYDREAFAKKFTADMAVLKAQVALQTKYRDAVKAKDWPTAESAVDTMIAKDPTASVMKFTLILMNEDNPVKAYAYGKEIVGGAIKDNADALNAIAWTIVDPERAPKVKDLDLALAAAERGVEVSKRKDYGILDTLARVYFLKGDKDKAIATQKEAIALATDPASKESLEKTLKEYGG
ncbi:MAG: hypothetical protein QOJ65_1270 [Fimbriimonadaceae bacterium]|nr:hypothetical protein [Fimbriimonadaceae bacterium]